MEVEKHKDELGKWLSIGEGLKITEANIYLGEL
jgi:hypothetical protein